MKFLRALGRSAAALAFVLLAACSVGCSRGEPATGVVHLAPKLASGGASVAELERVAKRASFVVEPKVRTDSIAPWKLEFAEVRSYDETETGTGFRVIGNVREGDAFKHVEIVLDEPLDAGDVDALELVVRDTQRGLARLTWRRADEPADADTWTRHVDAHIEDSKDEQTITLSLADHPEWRGRIARLDLVPKQDGWQRFELVRLSLVRGGFTPGPDRLEDNSDAGLVARERQTRRSFPTDFDVPLFARADVPRGGRFACEVALGSGARSLGETTWCAVDVREGTNAWRNAGRLELAPSNAPEKEWYTFAADLSDWAGRAVELRLRAFRGAWTDDPTRGVGGSLARVNVHWGAPVILGELEKDRRPNLILVTLDTTRADALAADRTPYFDALRHQSLDFTNAWCSCNATSPSHASILTG
ncbi:MAG: hypothetical protein K8S98_16155, partial [Planctomycetes bacterium]|nr:hypothetical protein [Planctomycetota bacterium]